MIYILTNVFIKYLFVDSPLPSFPFLPPKSAATSPHRRINGAPIFAGEDLTWRQARRPGRSCRRRLLEAAAPWFWTYFWVKSTSCYKSCGQPLLFLSLPPLSPSPLSTLSTNSSYPFPQEGRPPQPPPRFTVPQKYFLHFYIAALLWTTLLLVSTWSYAHWKMTQLDLEHHSVGQMSLVWSRHIVLLVLMELHILRRFFETAYVFDYGSSARMHIAGYFTGLYFYVAAPLSLCSSLVPAVLNYIIWEGMPLTEFTSRDYMKPLTQLGWCQWIGTAIFMWGWIHQLRCHAILGSLRKQPGTNEYVVPHGDWFDHVSCPHYLAEIVIYAGILLASGGLNLTVWLLFMFVASNLIFAAAQTHRWYHLKFESYPRSRHAIIPNIY